MYRRNETYTSIMGLQSVGYGYPIFKEQVRGPVTVKAMSERTTTII